MADSEQERILVVEDESHLAEGLKLNLTLEGYEVRIAADGSSALQAWKEWRPDLIVLDIMLPQIDGLSVLRAIRLEDERLPILILSAKADSEHRVKGFSYGVDDYPCQAFQPGRVPAPGEATPDPGVLVPRIGRLGHRRHLVSPPDLPVWKQQHRFRDSERRGPFRQDRPDRAGGQALEAVCREPGEAPFKAKAP